MFLLFVGISEAQTPMNSFQAFIASNSYQAEGATIRYGVIESNYSGYSGSGFVNYNNMVGSYIQWTINVPQAGKYHLSFRYANGTITNRPLEIKVNGVVGNPRLAFIGTSGWSSWQNQGFNTTLKAGANTIRGTATTSNGGPNMDRLDISSAPLTGTDWGKAVVDSTIKRFPTAYTLGPWHYAKAFFLYGAFQVYRRVGDDRYLTYIKNWVDSHVDSNGNIDTNLDALDNMQPGNLLLILYQTSGQSKYKTAAAKIRTRLNTYPRTSDRGFWHMVKTPGQLWLDGTYMALPFLSRYGKLFSDSTYANNETANQLIIYGNHLRDNNTGLLFHAYDEQGDVSWAEPTTHHSSYFWGRSIGWYAMATVDVLEILPKDHPKRAQLLNNLRSLVPALARYQNRTNGLWYQVVDKGSLSSNWLKRPVPQCSLIRFRNRFGKAMSTLQPINRSSPSAFRACGARYRSMHTDSRTSGIFAWVPAWAISITISRDRAARMNSTVWEHSSCCMS